MLPVDRHETGPQEGFTLHLLGPHFFFMGVCFVASFLFSGAWHLVLELAK